MPEKMDVIDGYSDFFGFCDKVAFFSFGLERVISIDFKIAEGDWNQLKNDIRSRNDNVFIRNFGRNGNGNSKISMMYKEVYGLGINFDPTNNFKPTQKLQKLTGYRKKYNDIQLSSCSCVRKHKKYLLLYSSMEYSFCSKATRPLYGA